MRTAAFRLRGSLVLMAAAVIAGGCSGVHSGQAGGGAVVRVSERDFRIAVHPTTVPAGEVSIVTQNAGPDTHELLIARAGGGELPLRADGLTVDESAIEPVTVGELPGAAPGSRHVLRVRLKPGRYILFCNMLGHYLGGMEAELVVR